MSVSDSSQLDALDAILYDRVAGRNIIGHAIDTINKLRAEVALAESFHKVAVDERNFERAKCDRLRELLRSLRSVVMEDYRHLIDAALGKEGS